MDAKLKKKLTRMADRYYRNYDMSSETNKTSMLLNMLTVTYAETKPKKRRFNLRDIVNISTNSDK